MKFLFIAYSPQLPNQIHQWPVLDAVAQSIQELFAEARSSSVVLQGLDFDVDLENQYV
jgi:hypothetical protein